MLLNEIINEVGMTKRAVKYYEESPQYAEYKNALDKVNDRMCRELGLHYDSNYNLVIKKFK